MTEKEIFEKLSERFGDAVLEFDETGTQPLIRIAPGKAEEIGMFLRDDDALQFDALMNLSGVDFPEELEVVYHLYSMSLNHKVTVKARVSKENTDVASVAMVWRTADWHEREAYDMFGINFTGHPDLRRILLPEDWEGYPLRKDYVTPEYYNGMKVPFPEQAGDLEDE
jgi:NADH-quinone oxidoreductase subunit C